MSPRRQGVRRSVLAAGLLVLFAAGARAQDFSGNTQSSSRSATVQPEDPLRAQAAAALSERNFPLALKLLTPLVEKYPGDAHVLFDLAAAQDALDQVSAAEQTYRRAIEADKTYFEPRLALGLLLARNGRAADARRELLAATNLQAPQPELKARAYRALAQVDAGTNPADARDALVSALKISPETPEDTMLAADLARAAEDLPAAETAYRRLLSRQPGDPQATAALAQLLIREHKTAEAEALLHSAMEKHPDDPAVLSEMATLYVRQGKSPDALALLEKLHAQAPEDANVTRLYARVLDATGAYDRAEPLLAGLLARTPGDLVLLDARADALIHLGRFAEAEALLRPVLAHPPAEASRENLADAAGHLAFAAAQNNDPATTLQALAVRATVLPQSPPTIFLEATAHDKLHHTKQAADLYKQFLSVANGRFPNEEWEARHRLVTLDRMK